ncbi:hypothetical protein B0O99DRAFT_685263 [Bisporella sp. PMI_857]|nr:hypothetical protein B0O99DRAFT_685263 [Bisporella sp. PMI_857]
MSSLHYSDQSLSTPLGSPLSDAESLSTPYHLITPYQQPAFECIVTIHTSVEKALDPLEQKALASIANGGGWVPRKDTILGQIEKGALDKNTPKDSLWRCITSKKAT